MTEKKLEAATADHQAKQAAVTEAEAALAEAAQAQVLADAATMTADTKGLDRAITVAATASARVDILGRKLVIARERLALAAEAVQVEKLSDLRTISAQADAALALVDESIQKTVPEAVAALLAIWTEAQTAVDQANAARAAVAKALAVPVVLAGGRAVEALVSVSGTRAPDPVKSTASLVAWINAAPARANEQRAREEMRAADKTQRDLAGQNGPDAQEGARLAARAYNISIGMVPTDRRLTDPVPSRPPPSEAELQLQDEQDLYRRGAISARHLTIEAG